MTELKMLYKQLRSGLKPGTKDEEYANWIRQKECHYGMYVGSGKCSGDIVADHVLGGYHGTKASGLLLIPSCVAHNNRAEEDPELHHMALAEAIELRLKYDQEKLLMLQEK